MDSSTPVMFTEWFSQKQTEKKKKNKCVSITTYWNEIKSVPPRNSADHPFFSWVAFLKHKYYKQKKSKTVPLFEVTAPLLLPVLILMLINPSSACWSVTNLFFEIRKLFCFCPASSLARARIQINSMKMVANTNRTLFMGECGDVCWCESCCCCCHSVQSIFYFIVCF